MQILTGVIFAVLIPFGLLVTAIVLIGRWLVYMKMEERRALYVLDFSETMEANRPGRSWFRRYFLRPVFGVGANDGAWLSKKKWDSK